jgi:hypothetical protein
MKMKLLNHAGLSLAVLMLGNAGSALAQTADYNFASFDSNINGVGNWYGSGVYSWDSTQDATGNGGGSMYVTVPNDSSSDTPLNPYICIGGGNPWYNSGTTLDLTQYKSIDFDIKWDNTSAITVDEFNNVSTWPAQFGTANFNGDPYGKPRPTAGRMSASRLTIPSPASGLSTALILKNTTITPALSWVPPPPSFGLTTS